METHGVGEGSGARWGPWGAEGRESAVVGGREHRWRKDRGSCGKTGPHSRRGRRTHVAANRRQAFQGMPRRGRSEKRGRDSDGMGSSLEEMAVASVSPGEQQSLLEATGLSRSLSPPEE